jgi:hypothetical protein
MKPKILSWNMRGLNEVHKRLRVRNLLQGWKVDIVCLQETKLHCLSRRLVRSLWRCNYVDWVCLDSCGASGGLLILWDKRMEEKIEECIGVYSLAVKFKSIEDDSIWAFAEVYGPNNAKDRRTLWDELAGLMSWWNLPWCIGGTSTSPTSLVRDPELLVVWVCQILLISFMIRGCWIYHLLGVFLLGHLLKIL